MLAKDLKRAARQAADRAVALADRQVGLGNRDLGVGSGKGAPLTPGPSPDGRGERNSANLPSPVGRGVPAGRGEGVRRCCIDQSGVGMMLAERLQKKYGARVEPVQFTAPVKERLAPLVKRHFEERLVRIPDQRDVRADLNAVKRSVTASGNVRYDAERTEHGHADRFWALALALEAAASTPAARFVDAGATLGRPVMAGIMERVL